MENSDSRKRKFNQIIAEFPREQMVHTNLLFCDFEFKRKQNDDDDGDDEINFCANRLKYDGR